MNREEIITFINTYVYHLGIHIRHTNVINAIKSIRNELNREGLEVYTMKSTTYEDFNTWYILNTPIEIICNNTLIESLKKLGDQL